MAVRGRMNPGMIEYAADFISPEIGVSSREIINTLSNGGFEVVLKSGLSEDEFSDFCRFRKCEWRDKLKKFYLSNQSIQKNFRDYNDFLINFRSTLREIVPRKNNPRCYSAGPAASHIIGYSSEVQNNFTAWKGLEFEYDDILRGLKGDVRERFDAFNRPIPGFDPYERGLVPGWNLRLTIAYDIQAFAYSVLEERVRATNAAGGTIIILDSRSAEVLAMVSCPSFDPVNYKEFLKDAPARPDLLPPSEYRLNPMHNLATQLQFEPGSVMKSMVAAWALKEGCVSPDDKFEVKPEGFKVPGKKNPIRDTHPPPSMELWDLKNVLVHSSNQGMAQVGLRVGRDRLIEGLSKFGFGCPSLDLIEEAYGDIRAKQKWWPVVQEATTAFGQGVSVTPIQLVTAYNVFANGGYYVKPRISLDATSPDGDVRCFSSNERIQVIPPDVLNYMLDALEYVVIEGTGIPAACKGYRVAGKTGTAQKPDQQNHTYFDNRHYSSFCGFGPLPEPRYTILILLDEPSPKWGGSSCGPAFKTIFETLMLRDGIPPLVDEPEKEDEENII
jgi:cell division protein FtsI/penicillin-binding protein 2